MSVTTSGSSGRPPDDLTRRRRRRRLRLAVLAACIAAVVLGSLAAWSAPLAVGVGVALTTLSTLAAMYQALAAPRS